jgi:hypothetical protein
MSKDTTLNNRIIQLEGLKEFKTGNLFNTKSLLNLTLGIFLLLLNISGLLR